MMKPVYLDLHIHTSENPDVLNEKYDVNALLKGVHSVCGDAPFLLSLTDHNAINKSAYFRLLEQADSVLLGAELHIRNFDEKKPYHCHIIFDVSIDEQVIDAINGKLDKLYPEKSIKLETKNVPTIEDICREFDQYNFMLLPHGGQTHSTFDKSIPKDVRFDSEIERNIYYNHFEGFTARSNKGLEETQEYFSRLGIAEFVNLVTCTDNYQPTLYPNAKSKDASEFVPTWMYALPTFEGLRLSLSEFSRFYYGKEYPKKWSEFIGHIYLKNEKIDIDVVLTSGLNVVIGGSSSGKTLFVDSLYSKLADDFTKSNYNDYGVKDIDVDNPSNLLPHYINQNYITTVLADKSKSISDIDIIGSVFPYDKEIDNKINDALAKLKNALNELMDTVKDIESTENSLVKIPLFTRLITNKRPSGNVLQQIVPSEIIVDKYSMSQDEYTKYETSIREIAKRLEQNPFVDGVADNIQIILDALSTALAWSNYAAKINEIINKYSDSIDKYLTLKEEDTHNKSKERVKLLKLIKKHIELTAKFHDILSRIATFDVSIQTKEIEVEGYSLSIVNSFKLTKERVLESFNQYLRCELSEWSDITPESLFKAYRKQRPNVQTHTAFANKVYADFEKLNKKSYVIKTPEGKDFNNLSAGWKTAAILEIVLGYEKDLAPLIIDQPEDNLANSYINNDLIKSIKRIKQKKQIILVSHNATIPMLGDAQNVILCSNEEGIIKIRSSPLEGVLEQKSMVDYIADITDGGKPSIKKRVKKYNLKSFKEKKK